MTEDDKSELVDHVAEVCDYDTGAMREIAARIQNEASAINEANSGRGDERLS